MSGDARGKMARKGTGSHFERKMVPGNWYRTLEVLERYLERYRTPFCRMAEQASEMVPENGTGHHFAAGRHRKLVPNRGNGTGHLFPA